MKTGINRLVRYCMAGALAIILSLQAGPAFAVFAELSPQEEGTVIENEFETDLSVINNLSEEADVSQDEESNTQKETVRFDSDIPENASSENSQIDIIENNEEFIRIPDEIENEEIAEKDEESTEIDPLTGFTDTKDHWATEVIVFWLDRKVVTGYPNGTFCPDASITREEAAALITKIRKLTGDKQPAFLDVSSENWAFQAIQACYAFDILKGTGNGFFMPGECITREAAMTMLYRSSDLSPISPDSPSIDTPDRDEVSDWAAEAVSSLLHEGIVTGDENGFLHPGDPVTRVEFLTILYRLEAKDLWDPSLQNEFGVLNLKWILKTRNPDNENSQDITVTASCIDERTLILPSGVDPHSIKLNYSLSDPDNTTLLISGNRKLISDTTFDLTDISYPDQQGGYPLTISISNGEIQRDYHYRVLYGTSLDTVFLSSDEESGGRFYVEKKKGNSVEGSMQMITPEGRILYDGGLKQLKSRGNSTFEYLKKPYQIKLDEKADLLGNGEKEKTWVLLANYADPSMMKDKLCKDLASDFHLPGSPDCKWVDLYFDGEYRGVYLLSEKIQISSNGLEITDLEKKYNEVNEYYGENVETGVSENKYGNKIQYTEHLNTPDNSKNGYLIELNNTQYDEINGFLTSQGVGVNIKAPEYLSQQDLEYISEYYQEFEDAVYAVNQRGRFTGINPGTKRSFTSYCDLDSMARMYLIYQFSLNADAYFGSTYFYMEDNILHQGPIWDSDLSFGIIWDQTYPPNHELQNSYLSEALERLPVFRKAVKKLYSKEFKNLELQYTIRILNEYKEQLALSESRNHLIWPKYYQIAARDVAYDQETSYDTVILDLQQWMTDRTEYLDKKFINWER